MCGRFSETTSKKLHYVELSQWEDCMCHPFSLPFIFFQHANKRSICIISIVRLVVMLESYKTPSMDVTWVFIGPSTWTAVETNIGIVSGNSSSNLSSSKFTNQVKLVSPHSYPSSNTSVEAPAAREVAIETRIGYLAGTEDHWHWQRAVTALPMIVIWLA